MINESCIAYGTFGDFDIICRLTGRSSTSLSQKEEKNRKKEGRKREERNRRQASCSPHPKIILSNDLYFHSKITGKRMN